MRAQMLPKAHRQAPKATSPRAPIISDSSPQQPDTSRKKYLATTCSSGPAQYYSYP
jgi:hypothetical protein